MVDHTSIVDVPPVLAAATRAGLWPSPPAPTCRRRGCSGTHGHVRFLVTELHPVTPAELTGLDVPAATRVLRAALTRTWREAARRLGDARATGGRDGAGTDDLHTEDSTPGTRRFDVPDGP
jgi:hypothetical protein